LNNRISIIVFSIVLISISPQVFGVSDEPIDISKYFEHEFFVSGFGEIRQTDEFVFEIGKSENVHVKHIMKSDKWNVNEPKLIKLLPGKHSNLQVVDEDGDYLRPMGFVGETFEESEYAIVGQKPFRAYDAVVEYDLENFLEMNENGLWQKKFQFDQDVKIFVDDEINLVFANGRPVDVSEAGGINCMGCDIVIEFFDEEKPIMKKIIRNETKLEEISNSGEEFILEFISDGTIGDVSYIHELNYFSFNTSKENQLFLVKIPLDFLLSPYHVFLTEIDQEILVDSDQIRKSEHGQTDTHANLSFKSNKEGVIHVVGATEMEHEKFLAKIQEKLDKSIKNEKLDDQNQNKEELEVKSTSSLYENWESDSTNNNQDNTIIFIIIGVIAVIIIAIIIKLKKN
jgi:hypothetical protein